MKTLWIIALALGLSYLSNAETSSAYGYVANGGTVQLTSGGAVVMPTYVYTSLDQGKMNPLLQLSLQQHIMNECLEAVLKETPDKLTSYQAAKAKFDQSLCRLTKCYQQMMILDYIAQSSSNPSANGGQTDPQSQATSQSVAAMLYSSVGQSTCQSGSSSVDPNLASTAGSSTSGSGTTAK